jgi:hypothetical protein
VVWCGKKAENCLRWPPASFAFTATARTHGRLVSSRRWTDFNNKYRVVLHADVVHISRAGELRGVRFCCAVALLRVTSPLLCGQGLTSSTHGVVAACTST